MPEQPIIYVDESQEARTQLYALCQQIADKLNDTEKALSVKEHDLLESKDNKAWPLLRREISNLSNEVQNLQRRYELNLIMLQKS
jgi:hypothetical protein